MRYLHLILAGSLLAAAFQAAAQNPAPFKVLFVGDSIVQGVGDEGPEIGFVPKLAHILPALQFGSIAQAGASTFQIQTLLQRELNSGQCSVSQEAARGADVVFVMAGTNDVWEGVSPESALKSIRVIVSFLRRWYLINENRRPIILVPTLLWASDTDHRRFVGNFNRILIGGGVSGLEVGPRFNLAGSTYFTDDGVHPSRIGYQAMADYLANYLISVVGQRVADLEGRGLFDIGTHNCPMLRTQLFIAPPSSRGIRRRAN